MDTWPKADQAHMSNHDGSQIYLSATLRVVKLIATINLNQGRVSIEYSVVNQQHQLATNLRHVFTSKQTLTSSERILL